MHSPRGREFSIFDREGTVSELLRRHRDMQKIFDEDRSLLSATALMQKLEMYTCSPAYGDHLVLYQTQL